MLIILQFIEHLLSSDHAENAPHLVAIGYELEALLSIYGEDAVRLSVASRPPSAHGAPSLPPPLPIGENSSPESHRDQAWEEAVEDEHWGISPTERIRYEVTVSAWEAGDSLDGVDASLVPSTPPKLRILVSLPPTYPNSSPPQLQLLGRYVGSFTIDPALCKSNGRHGFRLGFTIDARASGRGTH